MEPRKYAEKHECDLNMAFVGYPKTIRPRLCCVQTAQVSRNISLFRFYSSKSFLSVQSFNLNPCIRASAVTYEVTDFFNLAVYVNILFYLRPFILVWKKDDIEQFPIHLIYLFIRVAFEIGLCDFYR